MDAISVCNLGKAYKRYSSRWARLAEWIIPSARPRHELWWALRDINFTVRQGEAFGIVGINGAGKSTLLKLITGTVIPTCGAVELRGRVAALLELGMGFHPDFTGRQNVFMSGQLIGLSSSVLSELMPEIEAFAEIGAYIDQPVRVYSSGMQMRLAFSVATALRPDILIVDEALSVGDTYFQHKSFERIREFRNQGTTLLLVSHDKQAIQGVCDKAILLDAGRLTMEGKPDVVFDYYNAMIAQRQNTTIEQAVLGTGEVQTISGSHEAEIESAGLLNSHGAPVEVVSVGELVTLKVFARVKKAVPELVLGYLIKNRLGIELFGTNTHHLGAAYHDLKPGERVEYAFTFPANFGEGSYSVTIALHASHTHIESNYCWIDRAILFSVVNTAQQLFAGLSWVPPRLESKRGQ